MWNIMKAQNYQARGDNACILTLIFGLIFSFLTLDYTEGGDLTGSMIFIMSGDRVLFLSMIVVMVLTCRISGWDMVDRTMNYEVLSGHKRAEVYFGRVITSIVWSLVSCMVLTAIPLFIFTIINGWGEGFSFLNALKHYMLLIFPLFRLVCEMVLLTFLTQNCYAAMVLGWTAVSFSMIGIMVLEALTDVELSAWFFLENIVKLFQFDNYSLLKLGESEVMVFQDNLEPSFIGSTVAGSILVGGVCLAVGYFVFRKRDLR